METWQVIAMSIGFNLLTIIGCLLYCLSACREAKEYKDKISYLENALGCAEAQLKKAITGEDRRKKERRQ
jgi:hypothetical protein